MTEEMKKQLKITQRRTADGEPHDPDSEPEDDTTEPGPHNLDEQEESTHKADELLAANESLWEQDILESGKNNCQTPPRTLDKAYLQL